jgi:hypothetical protein
MEVRDEGVVISNVGFPPVVSSCACRIGLVEEIDRLLACDMWR